MGNKGDKNTSDSNNTALEIVTQLESIDGISSKKMFGGHGIFCNSKMFCIIDSKGQGFLKVGDSNKSDFEKFGSFKHSRMPYYSIPDNIINNRNDFIDLAKKSIALSQ